MLPPSTLAAPVTHGKSEFRRWGTPYIRLNVAECVPKGGDSYMTWLG